MADKITVEFDNARVDAALKRLADGVENPLGVLEAIGEDLAESTKQRFATSTAPDGSRWAPNAQATFESYLARDGKNFRKDGRLGAKGAARAANKRPLVDSGVLADTIAWQMVGDHQVEIGTNRFAGEWEGGAAVHQFGSRDGHIPARPFLGISDQDAAEIEGVVEDYLDGLIG